MRLISPAKRYNRGTGVPAPYLIDPDWRSEETRCCRYCGRYDDGLIKTGRRAYAHQRCFEAKYGPLTQLQRT
jgi:hypothetical protein